MLPGFIEEVFGIGFDYHTTDYPYILIVAYKTKHHGGFDDLKNWPGGFAVGSRMSERSEKEAGLTVTRGRGTMELDLICSNYYQGNVTLLAFERTLLHRTQKYRRIFLRAVEAATDWYEDHGFEFVEPRQESHGCHHMYKNLDPAPAGDTLKSLGYRDIPWPGHY